MPVRLISTTGLRRMVALALTVALCAVIPAIAVTPPAVADGSGHIGFSQSPKITKLIYPTFGNPAIIKRGEDFEVEFDPRAGSFSGTCPTATAFQVQVSSSNDSVPVIRALTVKSFAKGLTTRWPEWQSPPEGFDWNIYRVVVNVPYNVPHDLYNVTVTATIGGLPVVDTQPNCFQAVEQYKDHFSFIQLTDIHVFGPECTYPSSNFKERAYRHSNYSTADGYGATYYHKTIQQINRIKPDFCIFTGDYDFGQYWLSHDYSAEYGGTEWAKNMTEYEFEQMWFYNESLKLDVPVFMTMGNHDGYNDLTDDWFVNWRKLYGPVYHSFDYGQYHFISTNSMDWSSNLRKLTSFLIILQPTKYLGQFSGAGDTWQSGVSTARLNAINPNNFTQQLKWIRDDLAAHQGSRLRTMVMHCDPWKADGYGSMWEDTTPLQMGYGEGRLAIMRLMRDYNVALEISGHDHSDYYANVNWESYGGYGHTIMCNTTSTSFQGSGTSSEYPGYRRIWINNGAVESTSYYQNLSYPSYANTNVEGGSRDLGSLSTPCIEWGTPAGSGEDKSCTIANHYTASPPALSSKSFYVEFPMNYLSGHYYYVAQNGTLGEVYDNNDSSPSLRYCQVYADVAPGGSKAPRVYKSPTPDLVPPTGSILINNGATQTNLLDVTLTLSASDTGGSGLKDMQVSNRSDFAGASWGQVRSSVPWTLEAGESGTRTVYARYRDYAMPGNISATATASISYDSGERTSSTWYLAEGSTAWGYQAYMTIENPNDRAVDTTVTYMTPQGQVNGPAVHLDPGSQATINPADQLGENDFSTKVESADNTRIAVDRTMVWLGVDAQSTEAHTSVGVTAPAKTWYLPEGSSNWGFECFLLIQNPNSDIAHVTLTYMTQDRGPVDVTHEVPALGRATFNMANDIGAADASIRVVSDIDVIPERAMYRNSRREGHDSIGTTTPAFDYYLAEGCTSAGFTTFVLIQNPNDAFAEVTVTFMTPAGTTSLNPFSMDPNSRTTIKLNDVIPDADVSTKVSANQYIIAERAMYWDAGTGEACHDSIGMNESHSTFYLPDGQTSDGRETFTLVQNPNGADVTVRISYLKPDGQNNVVFEDTIPANSRRTYNMRDQGIDGRAAIAVESVTPGLKIMVERAMYWNSRGVGTDTIGGYSD